MTERHAAVMERSPYGDEYFHVQQAKSAEKVRWEYTRLLAMGGIRLCADACVLDAACGAAPGLRFFDGRANRVIGLDVASAALRAARQMLPHAQLVQANLDVPLPFAAQTFDLIILREAIEHVQDGPATLAACLRVLRPGGCVAITTPNRWDARRPLFAATRRVWSGDADPTHTHIYSPTEMRAILRRIGFRHVRVRTGFKPVLRLGGKRLPFRLSLPFPPLIGNGVVAFGWREEKR
ncbi:MAG: class I SAM-dependent methyltransferase [Chloroflexota bacterium]|nr:class I SAM-dependent methyltransferase [Chloroflexota bacterium]